MSEHILKFPDYYTWCSWNYTRDWEIPLLRDVFRDSILPSDVIYDLGANIGSFSHWVLTEHSPKLVYAFEPIPIAFQCLRNNMSPFDNCVLFELGIAPNDGPVSFTTWDVASYCSTYVSGDKLGNIKLPPDRHVLPPEFVGNAIPTTQVVECVNLKGFIASSNLEPPTIIKIDIEGAEYDFFDVTPKEFFDTVKMMHIEYHYNDTTNIVLDKIVERLLDYGYSIYFHKYAVGNDESGITRKLSTKAATLIAKRIEPTRVQNPDVGEYPPYVNIDDNISEQNVTPPDNISGESDMVEEKVIEIK